MDQSLDLRATALEATDRGRREYGSQAFWRRHLWWPLLAFTSSWRAGGVFAGSACGAGVVSSTSTPAQMAGRGPANGGLADCCIPAGAGSFAAWQQRRWRSGGCRSAVPRLREWRRPAGFVSACDAARHRLVGGLKAVTNVDCPWDLAGFGGAQPYVALFADRPDALPRASVFRRARLVGIRARCASTSCSAIARAAWRDWLLAARLQSASRSRSARKRAARISSRTTSRARRSSGSCSSGCTRAYAR